MTFIWPFTLPLLLLIPLAVWGYMWLQARRAAQAADLGPLALVRSGNDLLSGRRRHLPFLFFLIGLSLLLFGLARPEMVVRFPRVEGTVILAFDVSNSMLAEDYEPNRMEAAKTAARAFINSRPDTIQVGIVAFSNGGLIVQPPTDDEIALLDTIERLSPQGGTSLGQGIFTSLSAIAGETVTLDLDVDGDGQPEELSEIEDLERLQIGSFPSAVILMLTDGENTSNPFPLDMANIAAEASVRIYPIGIGSPEGTVIEVDGFSIITQLQEELLQEIAAVSNGTYTYAADEAALEEIYETVDLQLALKEETMEITSILAGLSTLFILIGSGLSMWWFGRIP